MRARLGRVRSLERLDQLDDLEEEEEKINLGRPVSVRVIEEGPTRNAVLERK